MAAVYKFFTLRPVAVLAKKNLGAGPQAPSAHSVSSVAIISSRWNNWEANQKVGGGGLEPPLFTPTATVYLIFSLTHGRMSS